MGAVQFGLAFGVSLLIGKSMDSCDSAVRNGTDTLSLFLDACLP